ncbi:MAG: CDC27 family protein [Methanomassiliicoccales archaeon]
MHTEIGSKGNPNFIEVRHGSILIPVPRSIFRSNTSELREKEAEQFKVRLAHRYPWLSQAAIEVVMKEAQATMETLLDMERSIVEKARLLYLRGEHSQALRILDDYLKLNSKDRDALYLKGEILFKIGDKKGGYIAFAQARKL